MTFRRIALALALVLPAQAGRANDPLHERDVLPILTRQCLGCHGGLRQKGGHAVSVALYAGLFEPTFAAFDLWNLSASHRQGPILLNVAKLLDVPQAVALASPRPVTLRCMGRRPM